MMVKPQLGLMLAASLLLMAPGVALPAGEISGISVAPSPACKSQPVTATVTGTGSCNKVVMVWEAGGSLANGTLQQLVPPPPFPIQIQHTYDQTGNVKITVRPGANSDCTVAGGEPNKSVNLQIQDCPGGSPVNPSVLNDICAILKCDENDVLAKTSQGLAQKVLPTIKGVLGALMPGAPMIIGGDNFGEPLGVVLLKGGSGDRQLAINEWHPGGIGGVVPVDIEKICPTGEIQVETKNGRKSNIWLIPVPHVVKKLAPGDLKVVKCDDDGNKNWCNGVTAQGSSCATAGAGWSCTTPRDPDWSLGALHYNCWGAAGNDSGTDVYNVSLKNGWVLDGMFFDLDVATGEGKASVSPLPTGKSEGAINVKWEVTPADCLLYSLDVYIAGPACTSHK